MFFDYLLAYVNFLDVDLYHNQSTNMSEIFDFRKHLKHGDQLTIAEATGYSIDMVRKVLGGTRNNDIILESAKLLIKNRMEFIHKSQTKLQEI